MKSETDDSGADLPYQMICRKPDDRRLVTVMATITCVSLIVTAAWPVVLYFQISAQLSGKLEKTPRDVLERLVVTPAEVRQDVTELRAQMTEFQKQQTEVLKELRRLRGKDDIPPDNGDDSPRDGD